MFLGLDQSKRFRYNFSTFEYLHSNIWEDNMKRSIILYCMANQMDKYTVFHMRRMQDLDYNLRNWNMRLLK